MPTGFSGVLDQRSGRIVTIDQLGEVYEYDAAGRYYHRPVDGPRPSGRWLSSLAYDSTRGRVMMFGGLLNPNNAWSGDTWAWDAGRWIDLSGGPAPSPRSGAAMCYDSARDRVVLFGGGGLNGLLRDTWEHDGVRWIQRSPATVPVADVGTMAFDSVRGVAVMLTAQQFGTSTTTYEWDGTDWTLASTAGPQLAKGGIAFDASRNRTVLLAAGLAGDQAWEWNGTQWTQVAAGLAPAREQVIVVDDPSGGVTLFGGADGFSRRTDRWEWDGSGLTRVHGDLVPPARSLACWAGDTLGGTTVLFGGVGGMLGGVAGARVFDDTWSWDGVRWLLATPPTSPPARAGAAVASNPMGSGIVLFGGDTDPYGSGNLLGDTWVWDGATWTPGVGPGPNPAPRSLACSATDYTRNTTLLFGGRIDGGIGLANDTWVWDGATWQQQTPATSPPPRMGAAMCWFPGPNETLMFGGQIDPQGLQRYDDLWVWNGSNWRLLQSGGVPPLAQHSLTYDFVTGQVLLTGLEPSNRDQLQTWRWDGSSWSQLEAVPALLHSLGGPFFGGPAVYHSRSRELAIYDGFGVGLRTTRPARVASVGVGCGAPAPRLAARTVPVLGDPSFGLEIVVRPGAPLIFALGDASQNLLVAPGCRVLVGGQITTALGVANGAGFAAYDLPIPPAVALLGADAFAQAAVLSPFATGLLDLSQALRVTVGR